MLRLKTSLALLILSAAIAGPLAGRAAAFNIALFPFLVTKGDAEGGWKFQFIWPVFDFGDTEQDNHYAVWPVAGYRHRKADDKRSVNLAWPLIRWSWWPSEKYHFHAVPFFVGRSDSVDYLALPPLYTHFSNREGRASFLWVLLFARYATNEGKSTVILPPLYWRKGSEKLEFFTLFPLVWWWDDGESFALFPLYGRRPNWNFFLFPLYLSQKKAAGTVHSVLWPLIRYGRGEDYVENQFFPLYIYRRSGDELKFEMFWPMVIYRKEKQARMFSIAPLFWDIERSDDEGNELYSTQALYPLYSWKTRPNGSTDFTFLDPLWFLWTANGREDHVSLFANMIDWRSTPAGRSSTSLLWGMFYKEEREDGSRWRIFPLMGGSENETTREKEFSLLWRLFRVKDSPEGKKVDALFLPIYRGKPKAEASQNGSE